MARCHRLAAQWLRQGGIILCFTIFLGFDRGIALEIPSVRIECKGELLRIGIFKDVLRANSQIQENLGAPVDDPAISFFVKGFVCDYQWAEFSAFAYARSDEVVPNVAHGYWFKFPRHLNNLNVTTYANDYRSPISVIPDSEFYARVIGTRQRQFLDYQQGLVGGQQALFGSFRGFEG